ncbi:FecR domain-containing protein [Fervidobacterium riparium]|uniref:FecR family protein n=1 Tax=Fervidobacterium gondwanense DSM 13020 TaxID=1121883 RepID=A0A1M7RVH0_FERGO|nr:FecR family protein [Fervidobacterium gondwanense]SHN50231.1 FecR family protein [Fervidobacterium gondwanense DSM 13020]
MMFKSLLRLLTTLFVMVTIIAFAEFKVVSSSESVVMGGKLPISIELTDKDNKPLSFSLKAKVSLGGFDKPEVLTKGLAVNGKITLNFLAPKKVAEVKVTFTAETPQKEVFTQEIVIKVTEKDESEFSEEMKASIDSFRGSVAVKKVGKKAWESIKKDTLLQEGDEVLTLEKSYIIVKFPDGSMTKITENTQVLFEKLRRSKDGKILVSIVIQKGGTYNVVQKMVAGSSFEVRAGSVTAGVRGTTFGVESFDDKPVVKVWEGEVFAFFGENFVIPVFEGQSLAYELGMELVEDVSQLFDAAEFEPLKEKLPDLEKMFEEIEVEPEKPTEPEKPKPEQEPTPQQPSQPKAFIPPLGVETAQKDNQKYIVYSISPEFTIGPVTLGVGLTAYATEVGGTLYYGVPSTEPSTNIINMITINHVALNLGNFYLRYGNMPPISLGMGFSVRDYFKPYAKSIDTRLGFGNVRLYLHLPYEITKIWFPEVVQSDSVFAGEFELKSVFAGMDLGIGALYDTEVSTTNTLGNATPVNLSLSGFVRYPLMSNFYLGAEVGGQFLEDMSKYGLGAFVGLSGKIAVFDVIAGAFGTWNGFRPFHFGRIYTVQKLKNELPTLESEEISFGFLIGTSLYTDIATGRLYLYGNFEGDMNALGEIRVVIPQIGALAGLFIYGYYFDSTPFSNNTVLDNDTICFLRITYPVMEQNLVAGMVYTWDGTQWIQSVYIGSESSW